jgi:hypothetical protein
MSDAKTSITPLQQQARDAVENLLTFAKSNMNAEAYSKFTTMFTNVQCLTTAVMSTAMQSTTVSSQPEETDESEEDVNEDDY